jgi:acyl carrier protein
MENNVGARVREMTLRLAPRPREHASSSTRLVEDLGYDSLALMELAAAIEAEFSLASSTHIEEAAAVETIGSIERLVLEMMQGQRSAG